MEKKFSNGAQTTRKPECDKKGRSCGDDCGQLDNIIGGFGKYQLMIFMFKILIGVTSAFNNLGVTFFAPSDFISFWCADSNALSTPIGPVHQPGSYFETGPAAARASSQHFNISSLSYDLAAPLIDQHQHQHPHAESYVRNESMLTISSASSAHHYVQHPSPQSFVTNNIRQLLSDFVYSNERSHKKQDLAYSSDTPRGLRKECDYLSARDNRRHKCTSFKYDTGIWISTIIDEWDLVCDRALFISITQSLYMAGFIVSYLVFGYISDRFGRWKSLVLGALIEILSGFGCALAGSIRSFMIFRFLLGLGNAGRSSSSYLIMIEWTGQSWRMHISTLGSLGWVFGYCVMPWVVLFFVHFRHMHFFVCLYESIFFIWLLRLPESPRWLLTHRRFNEAYEVLLNAAKFNGLILKAGEEPDNKQPAPDEQAVHRQASKLAMNGASRGKNMLSLVDKILASDAAVGKIGPTVVQTKAGLAGPMAKPSAQMGTLDEFRSSSFSCGRSDSKDNDDNDDDSDDCYDEYSERKSLQPYTIDEFDLKFARLTETISQKEFSKNEDRLSILDLFRWANLRKYTIILAFAWAVNSFIYYGIALRVGDLGGKNLFVSFTFAGATELPSIVFTMLCMKFLPRKTTNIFLFSIILLLCALQVPLKYYDLTWLQQVTMMLAKLFNSCSFTCILYQTMELFPTSIRQTAYSSCSLAGRIGSILAPFIKELSQLTNTLVPPIIYACLSILEIVLIRHLPETQGSDLPDTLIEAERFKGTDKMAPAGRMNKKTRQLLDSAGHHDKAANKMAAVESIGPVNKRKLSA